LNDLKLTLDGQDFVIPQIFFKESMSGPNKCLFLFEKNEEGIPGYDDIVTFD